jgi:serine/threonine protein kinase
LKSLTNNDKNDNIIEYHDYYKENGYLNIIMEYGGDKNLDEFIKDQKCGIDEDIIKKIVLQICNGLKKIHKANVIHRDLTPLNIFINTNNYSIKIGDFGISNKLETNQSSTYTMKGRGNYPYMPPEIIEGCKSEITNKVDIYSLGCIIYELFNKSKYLNDKAHTKEGPKKIDTDLYNEKWQNLIDILLEIESSKRPNIERVIQYISNIN